MWDYMNNEAQEMMADNLKITYTWEEQQLSTEKKRRRLYETKCVRL